MTVLSYLNALSSSLVLKGSEEESINTSIQTIHNRLTGYFNSNITSDFRFGSSTRGTILPRKADENSDIDYMVIFNTTGGEKNPQTYLTQLRKFAEYYYSTSEIHQSFPTIVLELSHIKFELVPAINDIFGRLRIPQISNFNDNWMFTNPSEMNTRLSNCNMNNSYMIKPLIRLIKYWNSLKGHNFASYDLENNIIDTSFWLCASLKDYFFHYWEVFGCSLSTPQYIKDYVTRTKDTVKNIQTNQVQGYEYTAEDELQKLLPPIG